MPTATDPGLMEYGEVVTFFHEFGHLMHRILGGQQQWAGISGISMESDFGKLLPRCSRSGCVARKFWLPSRSLQDRRAHPRGTRGAHESSIRLRPCRFPVSLQNTLSAISYNFYKSDPKKIDIDSVVPDAFHKYLLSATIPAEAHFYTSFNHLGGYSSAYYTYMYDKVIAEDFFQQFDQKNLLAGDAPMRYRHQVLEPGGSVSANTLVKNFLGRPQNTAAFQRWMGEEFEGASGAGKPGAH